MSKKEMEYIRIKIAILAGRPLIWYYGRENLQIILDNYTNINNI